MGAIFISYRREETAGEARALFNDLVATLGKDSVFMDVDNISLGRDFRLMLQDRLASCDLMIVLIGKDWLFSKNETGRSRLENPDDFVRLEVGTALKWNIPVTPVLVHGAQIPSADQLPEDLKDLSYRNGFELASTAGSPTFRR
jgi:TIR domain